ncbi:hypothetical protein ERJ75_001328200 [Trypanosoma vivax]|uniref:Uncharacterized protein n=1 Tax=Trypanosoma vivax (strain Y486) TaxID=1055687 RepID=G0U145_TRYVY|nr:hypothetical protein ERJ75_001328200 [Trypanosoma vivax]CCC49800.1 conserved hypothetical protein [Trypanosoma vivax Y486]
MYAENGTPFGGHVEHVRYKVLEKSGGFGEVVQVKVRDVGVNPAENTPPLYVKALRECPVEPRAFAGLGTGRSCACCAERELRIGVLEEYIKELERALYMNNTMNSIMCDIDTAPASLNSTVRSGSRCTRLGSCSRLASQRTQGDCASEDEGVRSRMLEAVADEMSRQELLVSLVSLLERPTLDEITRMRETMHAQYVERFKPFEFTKRPSTLADPK